MMKRSLVWLVCILMAVVLLSGCDTANSPDVVLSRGAEVSGGNTEGEGINLKDIGIEIQGADAVVNLSFISGSRLAGVDEAKVSSVPGYDMRILTYPSRLQIGLDIDYMDYTDEGERFEDSIIQGIFSSASGGKHNLYLQLNGDVEARVEEDGPTLKIRLTPTGQMFRSAWFVCADGFAEYEGDGALAELGMTPTLCEEKTNVVLTSIPYFIQSEAEAFEQELLQAYPDVPTQVVQIENGDMPGNLSFETETPAVDEPMAVGGEGGALSALPVLIENGKYLSKNADGTLVFSRPYLPDADQDNENVMMEEVLVRDPAGTESVIGTQGFYGVETAAFSADGRYLAILDSGIISRLLYVYDTETEEMYNLGEEGLGNITSSFVWDDTESIIYAMTGNTSLQLVRYDFSKPAQERVSALEERNGAESDIAFADGKVYFVDRDAGESGEVYAVDIETAGRTVVAEGVGFRLSPGGYYIASLVEVPEDEYSVSYNIEFKDIYSGETSQKQIAENVINYAFGADTDTLYYTTLDDEKSDGEYPFAFYKYTVSTGDTKLLGYLKTGEFVPGDNVGEVYITEFVMNNDNDYYITFIYAENAG